jgi:Ni,Fe-hydrogenase maturation factor
LRALNLLKHVAALPGTIRIIGCEPEELEELHIGLSPAVSASVATAVAMAVNWIGEYRDAYAARTP